MASRWEKFKQKNPLGSIERRVYFFNGNYKGARLTVWALNTIYEHQSGRCVFCQQSLNLVGWDIDHRVPIARGGVHASGNLQLACSWCNRGKGTMTGEEFVNHCKIVALNNS